MTTTHISTASAGGVASAAMELKESSRPDLSGSVRCAARTIGDDIPVGSYFAGWREHSSYEGEQWLRKAAESGDAYAMQRLGLRLVNGHGVQQSLLEGFDWLRRSASLGNLVAMAELGECLLDDDPQCLSTNSEGYRWLQKSVDSGNKSAAMVLATRLINGTGIPADPDRGKRMLICAAQAGSQLAHAKLAACLLAGRGLQQDREEGLRWLRRAGVITPIQISLAGYYVYAKARAATAKSGRRALSEEAASLIHESIRCGNVLDELSIIYLLRRREISADHYLPLDTLLAPHVRQNRTLALVNQALCLAEGIGSATDWNAADALIGRIREVDGAFQWWFACSEEGDPEGDLVTGWLVRHQLALDPDQISLECRMDLARKGGWMAPEWMNRPASGSGRH